MSVSLYGRAVQRSCRTWMARLPFSRRKRRAFPRPGSPVLASRPGLRRMFEEPHPAARKADVARGEKRLSREKIQAIFYDS